ncbi:MAG: DUF6116 family protein [Wenzhouxiangellaceae bacterium]|nr:DUF6116 family protein [Wenzhouxiangellaceae bacterium]
MLPAFIRRFLERRRFPTLLLIAAAALVVNILIPDAIPFIDELLMLLATLLIGSLRKPQPQNTPPDS